MKGSQTGPCVDRYLPRAVRCIRLPLAGFTERQAGANGGKGKEPLGHETVWGALTSDKGPAEFSGHSQRSSRLMKSVIPRFSKNTPDEALVLKKKDTSALSSACKVGK